MSFAFITTFPFVLAPKARHSITAAHRGVLSAQRGRFDSNELPTTLSPVIRTDVKSSTRTQWSSAAPSGLVYSNILSLWSKAHTQPIYRENRSVPTVSLSISALSFSHTGSLTEVGPIRTSLLTRSTLGVKRHASRAV